MNRFERVKKILDDSVSGADFGAHGRFWVGLSRDDFVEQIIFGRPLLAVGDGAGSNLVKALVGELPFGLDTETPGAIFRRMPADRDPVRDKDILFIRRWIDDGCPAEAIDTAPAVDSSAGGAPDNPKMHNDYWRDFDDWAMFHTTPEVGAAINEFFAIVNLWMAFAKDAANEGDWSDAIRQQAKTDAINLLALRQMETVQTHYGSPVPLLTLLDSYERFGNDSLPDDLMRPQDLRHNMNGPMMWFMWSAFADACLRVGITPDFWHGHIRAILLGLMNDGLFRGRFAVTGFSADEQGKADMRAYVRSLPDDEVQGELVKRFVDSSFA